MSEKEISIELDQGAIEEDSFSGELFFPTMVFSIICAGHAPLNDYLLQCIYEERSRDQDGIHRSNIRGLGGWHSHNNLHKDLAYDPLTDRIRQAGRRISEKLGYHSDKHLDIGTMWSIINPPGSANKAHIHPGSHWSGVYYIHTPEQSGDIEFTDPRTHHIMNEPRFQRKTNRSRENWTKVQYTPTAGKMLVFPSWLYHSVEPNLSGKRGKDGDRVIVSFNMSQIDK